jgi:hypothetical protein
MEKWTPRYFEDSLSKEVDEWIAKEDHIPRYPHLLKGSIDLHTHSSPSVLKRKFSDIEYARQAKSFGMKGIAIKAHEGDTTTRAVLIQELFPDQIAVGGVALNNPVGGFNLQAVKMSHQLGGSFVWLPTADADNHYRFKETGSASFQGYQPGQYGGLTVLDDNGEVKKEVKEILEYVGKHRLILASGHLSIIEIKELIPWIQKYNINNFVVQHPDIHFLNIGFEDQKLIADAGFYLEKCLFSFLPNYRVRSVETLIDEIREIGVNRILLVTDFGQWHHPSPILGVDFLIHLLKARGYTDQEVTSMASENPLTLLNNTNTSPTNL